MVLCLSRPSGSQPRRLYRYILPPRPPEHYHSCCILARYERYVIDWVLMTRYCHQHTIELPGALCRYTTG